MTTHQGRHHPMNISYQHLRRAIVAGTLLAATATLSACGGDESSSSSTATNDSPTGSASAVAGEFNEADVTFASQMIVHHASAVHMAKMVDGKEVSAETAQLADAIEAAQTPEIEQMSTWLEAWGEPVPDVGDMMSGMNGMDMGDMDMGDMSNMDMPGMMSEGEMSALADAEGAEFETMWLEMMVKHHQGAVEMAQTEQADGQYQPAIDLAEQIETSQTAEIDEMQAMLDR